MGIIPAEWAQLMRRVAWAALIAREDRNLLVAALAHARVVVFIALGLSREEVDLLPQCCWGWWRCWCSTRGLCCCGC